MRIGIDCRMWNESGIGRYIRGLVRELSVLDKSNSYVLFGKVSDLKRETLGDNFEIVEADFGWYGLREQVVFPKLLGKSQLDLVHFPHFNVPVLFKGDFVVTIHDLLHQKYGMRRSSTRDALTYGLKKIGYGKVFGYAVGKAKKILVPSQFVKKDLEQFWKVDQEKIVVTTEGVDESFLKLAETTSREKVNNTLKRLGVGENYLFYVGNVHPHKNIEGLIAGFVKLRAKYPDLELVLAGKENFFWRRILKEAANVFGVRYLGYISDGELVCLLKGAKMLVEPSFEEGFGLPLLEAFACRCPVVSSLGGSLKEVGGGAAAYFDPKSLDQMVEVVERVLTDVSVAASMRKGGAERVKLYSWRKMAQQTLDVYKSVI